MLELIPSLRTNSVSLERHINILYTNIFKATSGGECAGRIARNMKKQVISKRNWVNKGYRTLDQSGGFLSALGREVPTVETLSGRRGWVAVFGNIDNLNRVTRPEQEVATSSGRKYKFKKGSMPIWILAEFGSRSRRDKDYIPKEFRIGMAIGSNKRALSVAIGKPAGHKKRIHYMYNPKQADEISKKIKHLNIIIGSSKYTEEQKEKARETLHKIRQENKNVLNYRRHPGQFPNKPFRMGLYRSRFFTLRTLKSTINSVLSRG